MFAVFCRTRLRVPRNYDAVFTCQQFSASQNTVLVRSCSSSVCENAPQKSFTVSYLINTCGLSSDDAASASKKVCFKSPENPDAVLKILREYGFKDAHHIPRIVTSWPKVLVSCPSETLLPKLEFLCTIGVPLPVLAQKLSVDPAFLQSSLKNSIIPSYNYLKALLQSDERVVQVFKLSPRFLGSWAKGVSSNVSMLRERGVPLSSIVRVVKHQPALLLRNGDKLAVYVDRVVGLGFDVSKSTFVHAIYVLSGFSEMNLKRKMEVYKKYGWSESDIVAAFLKHPNFMKNSEEKITGTMDFLVDKLGCKPAAIAQCPFLLGYSLDKRIKPRGFVAKVLDEKGLKDMNMANVLTMSEDKFLNRYIVKYEKDIPELMDIYLGKVAVEEPRPLA